MPSGSTETQRLKNSWESTVARIGLHQGYQQSQSEQSTDRPPAKWDHPPKPDEDRSQPYRDRLAHNYKRRVHTLLQLQDASRSQIFTTKAACRIARKDGITEQKARTLSQHAEHHNLRKLTHFTILSLSLTLPLSLTRQQYKTPSLLTAQSLPPPHQISPLSI